MALQNATLILNLDRKDGTFAVDSRSSSIYSQDENIYLDVGGWTLDEVTKTQGKTPYEPYFRIVDELGFVLSEAKLEPASTPTPSETGTYSMFATLSTNTDKMVGWFAANCAEPGSPYLFNAKVYSTQEANPIATGSVFIRAFGRSAGPAPSNLPTASEVLASIRDDLNAHKANRQNPHSVTAAQVGAYSTTAADAQFATQVSMAAATNAIAQANVAIQALQSALATANATIAAQGLALTQKADAASTYRKDETYSKAQVNTLVAEASTSRVLHGKTFSAPKNAKERGALLAYVVQALGGNISSDGITPGTAPTRITMTASDGTTKAITIVKDGNEYTTEVV